MEPTFEPMAVWLRQHYVVAGRIERNGQLGGRFAWVAQGPHRPKDFMKAALDDHRWTEELRVTVLAGGADGLKTVIREARQNILDWFPISMRLRPIEQMGPKVADVLEHANPAIAAMIRLKLPKVRYQMWNGKWASAIHRMRGMYLGARDVTGALRPTDAKRVQRFRQHLLELRRNFGLEPPGP